MQQIAVRARAGQGRGALVLLALVGFVGAAQGGDSAAAGASVAREEEAQRAAAGEQAARFQEVEYDDAADEHEDEAADEDEDEDEHEVEDRDEDDVEEQNEDELEVEDQDEKEVLLQGEDEDDVEDQDEDEVQDEDEHEVNDQDEDQDDDDEDGEATASSSAGLALVETGAGTRLAREHMRVLTELVEEKLRVAPSSTLASISTMLSTAHYQGGGSLCMDFTALGAAPASVTTTTTKIYNTLPGTYKMAAFTCPPSAANVGELTCTGWGGNMPWKHYLHFTQAQKPQLSLYDCFNLCKNSLGCKYYWWQVAQTDTSKQSQAVCSLLHDTKAHAMAACTANPMMAFPWAGQTNSATYCPLVLDTRKEIASNPLACTGTSPPTQKDCIYKVTPPTLASASPTAAR